jgi:hypothetical protein
VAALTAALRPTVVPTVPTVVPMALAIQKAASAGAPFLCYPPPWLGGVAHD